MAGSPDRDPMPRVQPEHENCGSVGFPSTYPKHRPKQNSLLNPECAQEVEPYASVILNKKAFLLALDRSF